MPDSPLQNLDTSEALTGKPSIGVVDKFSQIKMESIIEAVVNHLVVKQEESAVPQHHQNQEKLAQGLATAVIEGAFVQLNTSWNGPQTSSGEKMAAAEACSFPIEQRNPAIESQCRQSNLVQSSLPPMGSLDYPDAPPTTPLVLDLERGQDSFARKLKGGLAKVFLPSPPPPTPMDGQGEPASALNDPQRELMEHLMRSLPRNDSVGLDIVDRGHFEEDVEVFAEVLSCSIINSSLRTQSESKILF